MLLPFVPLICLILFWVDIDANDYANPIALAAGDPWIQYHKGYYYLLSSTNSDYVGIRKAKKLGELIDAPNTVVYKIEGHDLYAPEIHLIDGRWYLFYSSCAPDVYGPGDCHRIHVAEGSTDDPMGPYKFKADLNDPNDDIMEIDASYMIINNKQYLLGSLHGSEPGNQLYIRPMKNPYTPTGPRHTLIPPMYDWEMDGNPINEAPEALFHDGRIFLVYSACDCAFNYKLGLLEFVGTDPLDATHWHKYPEPIFQRSDTNHVYAPGHNGFFKSPDGKEDWIVYHANARDHQGCSTARSARAQKFTWGRDGLPVFGVPDATDVIHRGPSGE